MPGAFTVRSIGVVRNAVEETGRRDWDNVISEIRIDSDLANALKGIEEFSHIYVLYYLHKLKEVKGHTVRPRGRKDMPEVGVLASRSPNHPNPLGLTLVKLLERRGHSLIVKGLDAIDGTQVIDIKAYDSHHDSVDDEKIPQWLQKLIQESVEGKA